MPKWIKIDIFTKLFFLFLIEIGIFILATLSFLHGVIVS